MKQIFVTEDFLFSQMYNYSTDISDGWDGLDNTCPPPACFAMLESSTEWDFATECAYLIALNIRNIENSLQILTVNTL